MSEDTPPPQPNNLPPVETDSLGSKRMKRNFWQRIGASGLSVSLAIHVVLVFIAAAFVVSTVTDNAKKDPNTFATGAGGGSGGERVKSTERKVQPKNVKSLAKTTTRITSKSASSSIALPEMPSSASASSMISGATAGGASKGFGGGAGGGIGSGKGMGSGGGKNFVARPVMGASIFSQRLAVYFDASGSMLPYLERVEAEIRDKFPDADVFLGNGAFIDVHDVEIVGGDKFKGTPFLNRPIGSGSKKNAKGELVATETNPAKLTTQGRTILKKYGNNFKMGSVGAWLDVLKDDRNYDGLIIFSDFADGVRQIRTKAVGGLPAYKPEKGYQAQPPVVFSDRNTGGSGFARSVILIANGGPSGQPVVPCKDTTGLIVGMVALGSGIPQGTTVTEIKDNVSFTLSKPLTAAATGRIVCNNGGDRRFPEEKKWEEEWVQAFAGAKDNKGPRLYLMSISRTYGSRPGSILQRCMSASGGVSILVKFGSAKKGEPYLYELTPNGGDKRDPKPTGEFRVADFDDLYVGMPISGKGVAKDAVVVELPTYKEVKKGEFTERVGVRPMKISAPITEDSTNVVFTFTPLIQAVGTIAKNSKNITDASGSVDISAGMVIQDARFPAGTKVISVTPNKAAAGFFTVEMSAPATAAAANDVLRFRPASSSAGSSRGAAPTR